MALSKEEQEQLAALQAKEQEPDEDNFDIEIWDETGAGAKVPYHKGRSWLQRFGIDLPEQPAEDQDQDQGKPPKSKPASTGNVTHAQKYFGSNNKRAG